MSQFLVEIYTPVRTSVAEIEERVSLAAAEMTRAGNSVRYLSSIFVPEDETCFYLFEARSAEAVRAASERAGLERARVLEAQSNRAPTGRSRSPARRSRDDAG